MIQIKQLPFKDLKKADFFQNSILNPSKRKRYRPYSTILKNYKREPSLFIAAYDKNKIIGVVFGYIKKNKVLLGEIAVSKNYQKQNIGKKLLNKFEENSKKLNKKYIILGSLEYFENFYLKQGYYPILFLQIKHKDCFKNYKDLDYKIIKETNYKDAKRLFIQTNKVSRELKLKAKKDFNAYDAIFLFKKNL